MFNGLLFSTPSKIIRKDEQLRMSQLKKISYYFDCSFFRYPYYQSVGIGLSILQSRVSSLSNPVCSAKNVKI